MSRNKRTVHENALFLLFFAISLQAQTPAEKQVDSLIQVSRSLTGNQEFEKALDVGRTAVRIASEKCGRMSRVYGSACFNQGRVLYFQGIYDEAEPWYLESKIVRANILGTEDQDYGRSVNNLAILYDVMGQYEKAEPLYLETLGIREKTAGKESATYADALSNLASLYMQMGYYENSERLNLEAMHIREKVPGKEDPAYASSLNNLANLYYVLHNYEKAEPLYLESIAIREKAGDRESVDYLMGLNNAGVLYQTMGRFDRAETFHFLAKDLWEKTFGAEHPGFVLSLNYLAHLCQDMHDYTKAESFYLQAQSIGEKVSGKEHPDNILNQESLAVLYAEKGQYEKAEPLLLECNALFAKVLGKEHPFFSSNLDFLADLYRASGNEQVAASCMSEAARRKKKLLVNASRHLSERELASYTREFAKGLSANCSFAHRHAAMAATCYDDVLFYKGFLLNAVSRVRKLASADPAGMEKDNLLKSVRRRLAAEYAKPLIEQKGVEALETQADQLEKELTRTVAGYGEAIRQFTWQDVQLGLQPGALAIEFVHYKYGNPKPTDSTLYAALLISPDEKEPIFLPLFEEKQLAALLKTTGARKSDFVDRLYATADRGAAPEETLYELVWQPLEKALATVSSNAKTIYFSPSGLLHGVNLAAVVLPEGQSLADRYNMVQLGSTRQLAMRVPSASDGVARSHPVTKEINAETALLFGGIQYNLDSTALAGSAGATSSHPGISATDQNRGGSDLTLAENPLRGTPWNYLKATEKEVDQIGGTMAAAGIKPVVLKGVAATEEAFKAITPGEEVTSSQPLTKPRILHFATHGFFYPNPESNISKDNDRQPVFKISDHPMMRSGLLLAGGNYAWQSGKPWRPDMEDGILTAYEIAQTDLSQTELVALSACETGLGDIQGDEGVYGLQRAFKIAGAKYLLMSLWRVPDAATQELMTTFYQKWLVQKMAVPDAFRAAQKEMRDKYQHPFFWAGFVLVE